MQWHRDRVVARRQGGDSSAALRAGLGGSRPLLAVSPCLQKLGVPPTWKLPIRASSWRCATAVPLPLAQASQMGSGAEPDFPDTGLKPQACPRTPGYCRRSHQGKLRVGGCHFQIGSLSTAPAPPHMGHGAGVTGQGQSSMIWLLTWCLHLGNLGAH